MKQGWEIKNLGEVCESDLGKTLNHSKDKGKLYPYLCSVNVLWDKFDFTVIKQARFDDNELERYTVKKGDLLVCEGGDIGRAAIWNQENTILYQNALHRVRFNNDVVSRFVFYFLKSLKLSGVLDTRYGKGVTIKHLVKSSLLSIPMPIPPREEQERIVGELDCLSGIIERKRAQLRELDSLAQSIFYTMFGDPITNDKGWQTKKLGEVCKTTSGGTPAKGRNEYYDGGTIPWLRSGEVNKMYIYNTELFITDKGLQNSSAKWFPENTVVIAMYGATVGQVGILQNKMTTNQAICGIFPNEIFAPIYLYYFMRSMKSEFIKLSSGGAQPNISQSIIRETFVVCPPIELQNEFAAKIENIEKQKELIKQSMKETEDLFNSRMNYYFD